MADDPKPAPGVKPGYQTTEFWLSMAAMLVGALLSSDIIPSEGSVMKILGVAAMALSLLGYQVTRGGVKKAAQVLIVVLLPLAFIGGTAGCHKGEIHVDAVAPLTTDVCDRHDKLLTGQLDPKSISEADKATYLRSSQLLRKVLDEARK